MRSGDNEDLFDINGDCEIARDLYVGRNFTIQGDLNFGDAVTDTLTVNGIFALAAGSTIVQTDNPFAVAQTVNYLRSSVTATSGDHNTLRLRAEGEATSAGGEVRALLAQSVVGEGKFANVVQSFLETIIKGNSTVVTARGLLVGLENETSGGAPTITDAFGIHIRPKLQTAPSGNYFGALIENEKIGAGVAHDAMLAFKTTTWGAGETIATDLISSGNVVGTITNMLNLTSLTATNLLKLQAVGTAPVGANTVGDATFANWVPVAVDIGGTPHKMIAAQTIS
jgi:hypothetical protein